jgi:hypothetical protein
LVGKPTRSFNAVFMLANHYPSFASTHVQFGTIADPSNKSIFVILQKFGLAGPAERPLDVFHLDIFPRRLLTVCYLPPVQVAFNAGRPRTRLIERLPVKLALY